MGLYYHRARYYDPRLGRVISEDPIGFAGGVDFYGYVGNDPVGSRDPLGLVGFQDWGTSYYYKPWDWIVTHNRGNPAPGFSELTLIAECHCTKECGGWRPRLNIHTKTDVYVAEDHRDPQRVRAHEDIHVADFRNIVNQALWEALRLEGQTFGTQWGCETACFFFQVKWHTHFEILRRVRR
jgi:hypothetical protein